MRRLAGYRPQNHEKHGIAFRMQPFPSILFRFPPEAPLRGDARAGDVSRARRHGRTQNVPAQNVSPTERKRGWHTVSSRTKSLEFRGLGSSRFLNSRVGERERERLKLREGREEGRKGLRCPKPESGWVCCVHRIESLLEPETRSAWRRVARSGRLGYRNNNSNNNNNNSY